MSRALRQHATSQQRLAYQATHDALTDLPNRTYLAEHLERMVLRRHSEDDVPHLGTASLQYVTWSVVSGFKGLENDDVVLAGVKDIAGDWHR